MPPTAFAVAAHPDDIEFMMAGTLLHLARRGWDLHVMNIANGCCGSTTAGPAETVRIRSQEARDAAEVLGAAWHGPLVDDLQVVYTPELVSRCCAIVRNVRPSVLLLQSPQDYMEDHVNASRLFVTAGFCRGMPNFPTDPPVEPIDEPLAVYHALPYGLKGPLREPIAPHFCVDIGDALAEKRRALACHRSQKQWLDVSQGQDQYLHTMERFAAEAARLYAPGAQWAEGWRRRLHLGFAEEDFDPLAEALGDLVIECAD